MTSRDIALASSHPSQPRVFSMAFPRTLMLGCAVHVTGCWAELTPAMPSTSVAAQSISSCLAIICSSFAARTANSCPPRPASGPIEENEQNECQEDGQRPCKATPTTMPLLLRSPADMWPMSALDISHHLERAADTAAVEHQQADAAA